MGDPRAEEPDAPALPQGVRSGFHFPPLNRKALVGLAAGLVLAGAVFGLALMRFRPARPPDPAPFILTDVQARSVPERAVEPVNAPAQSTDAASPYFSPGGSVHTRFARWRRFLPPIEPVDTRTFDAEGMIIRIADIEPPTFDSVCLDAQRNLWACGLQTRAALFNRIRSGVLECLPRIAHQPVGEDGGGWRCTHNGEDVALWMIRSGWALPLPRSERAYFEAMNEARVAARGLWNGGWSLLRRQSEPPPAPARPAPKRR